MDALVIDATASIPKVEAASRTHRSIWLEAIQGLDFW